MLKNSANIKCAYCYILQHYSEALKNVDKKENPEGYNLILFEIASFNMYFAIAEKENDPEKKIGIALEIYQKLIEEIGDKQSYNKIVLLNNIGAAHYSLYKLNGDKKEREMAINYFKDGLKDIKAEKYKEMNQILQDNLKGAQAATP